MKPSGKNITRFFFKLDVLMTGPMKGQLELERQHLFLTKLIQFWIMVMNGFFSFRVRRIFMLDLCPSLIKTRNNSYT